MILNIHTSRIETKKFKGMIQEQLLKKSQELFVLALLRYIYPEKYDDVIHSDRPDLQGKAIAIEVTMVDSPNELQVNKEFAKYCNDHKDIRKKTILANSNMKIETIENVCVLSESGGYNGSDDKLLLCIENKIKKAMKYPGNYEVLELALIKKERPLQPWIASLNMWIKPLFKEDNPFRTIYVIFPNAYFVIEKDKDGQLFQLDSKTYQALCKIGRMTAEGEITLEDEEWH